MLNHIVIMGHFTADPELRESPSKVKYTKFTLACERDNKNGGEKKTDFIDCFAFRNTANFICNNFWKGSAATVEGRLQIREWENREGVSQRTAEIRVDNIYFGGSRKLPQDSAKEA